MTYRTQHWLLIIFVVLLDVLTKWLAWLKCSVACHIMPGVQMRLVYNTGIVWGINSTNMYIRGVFGIFQLLLLSGLLWYIIHEVAHKRMARAATCVLAGGLANGITRLVCGSVIDFIIIGYGAYTWPAFNIADVAIVGGSVVLAWQAYREHAYA